MNKEEYFNKLKVFLKHETLEDMGEFINHYFALGNYFNGVWTEKNPIDAWQYQEIITHCKPDVIIELGSFKGGSALYLASLCDLVKHSEVISIEINDFNQEKIKHDRITWILGDILDVKIIEYVMNLVKDKKTMVILDADHSLLSVSNQLKAYYGLVSLGQYLIIEDTLSKYSKTLGPLLAVEKFLASHPEFEIDENRQRHLFTSNFNGYLKRIK